MRHILLDLLDRGGERFLCKFVPIIGMSCDYLCMQVCCRFDAHKIFEICNYFICAKECLP